MLFCVVYVCVILLFFFLLLLFLISFTYLFLPSSFSPLPVEPFLLLGVLLFSYERLHCEMHMHMGIHQTQQIERDGETLYVKEYDAYVCWYCQPPPQPRTLLLHDLSIGMFSWRDNIRAHLSMCVCAPRMYALLDVCVHILMLGNLLLCFETHIQYSVYTRTYIYMIVRMNLRARECQAIALVCNHHSFVNIMRSTQRYMDIYFHVCEATHSHTHIQSITHTHTKRNTYSGIGIRTERKDKMHC